MKRTNNEYSGSCSQSHETNYGCNLEIPKLPWYGEIAVTRLKNS
jgi:hypothetical protein